MAPKSMICPPQPNSGKTVCRSAHANDHDDPRVPPAGSAIVREYKGRTDVAVEAGDVVLVRSDPRDVPAIIELSRATYRKMLQNLWWAAGDNILAIPLAGVTLAAWGILLPPAMGAVLMSLSTIIVAINAQLLRMR